MKGPPTIIAMLSVAGSAIALPFTTTGVDVVSTAIAAAAGPANPRPSPPRALPQNASERALQFQPLLDYDLDSCYNVPAIDAQGNLAQGLKSTYQSNTRYEHYFEKDVGIEYVAGIASGHRHEWENAVVVVRQNEDLPRLVSASAHDGYDTREPLRVRFQDGHAKIVYHKNGAGTHALRFANARDEDIENDRGVWMQGALVDWNGFPSIKLRNRMVQAFNGTGTQPKIADAHFGAYLAKAIRHRIPEFDPFLEG
ncbi:hypothetical protein EsDP_00006300 [Epichloe bromicola]|uniref:Uncharacterized protein n=1 Tax=Epichloe bromicola TaxID=79588 RepID=A0ABQ0CXE2_9HYPO